MKLARTRLLLIAWLAVTIVPGVVAAAAFHISINERTGESSEVGWPLLVWILGFLAQLLLFMAITRNSRKANLVPWLIASLLPMVCDWTAQVTLWAAVPCTVAAVGLAVLVYVPIARSAGLTVDGVPATGTVLQVIEPHMNLAVNNVSVKRKVRMHIVRTDGTPPYEGVLDALYMLTDIPIVGDVFALRVDPKHPQRFQVDDAATETAATAPPAMSTTSSPASRWPADDSATTGEDTSTASQLERLTKLHASGGLSDTEFERAKARVLKS